MLSGFFLFSTAGIAGSFKKQEYGSLLLKKRSLAASPYDSVLLGSGIQQSHFFQGLPVPGPPNRAKSEKRERLHPDRPSASQNSPLLFLFPSSPRRAFFWLVSLLLASLVWFVSVQLTDQSNGRLQYSLLMFGAAVSVLLQELFRFAYFKLLK